jgi:hypothetical protein
VTARICAKTSLQTSATKELAAASQQCTISHCPFTRESLLKTTWLSFPLTWFFVTLLNSSDWR